MFDDMGDNIQNVEAQNAPSLSFTATPILGNVQFNVQQSNVGQGGVSAGWPAYGYLSVESLLFFQSMISTAVSPMDIVGGSTSGQQTTSGLSTQQDATGTTRLASGYQNAIG
jgi:hypothetical protein